MYVQCMYVISKYICLSKEAVSREVGTWVFGIKKTYFSPSFWEYITGNLYRTSKSWIFQVMPDPEPLDRGFRISNVYGDV